MKDARQIHMRVSQDDSRTQDVDDSVLRAGDSATLGDAVDSQEPGIQAAAIRNGACATSRIRIGAHSYRYDRTSTLEISSALQGARETSTPVFCECAEPSPRLVIHRSSRVTTNRYWLATWPRGGPAHSPGCLFHHPIVPDGNDRGGQASGIEEFPSGFRIHANFSLSRSLVGHGLESCPVGRTGSSFAASPAATTLLGILRYLVEAGGLNRHTALVERQWPQVAARLGKAIEPGWLGTQSLPELLYVVPFFDREQPSLNNSRRNAFLKRHAPTAKTVPRFLLLGEINEVRRMGATVKATLHNFSGTILLTEALEAALARRHPSAALALSSERKESRVLGLYLVEITGVREFTAIDAALLLTSRGYMPCESSHEALLANLLARSNRQFEKPMRTDPATGLRPDFILLDTRPPCPMEIWGMDTFDYKEKRALKLQKYRDHKIALWEWDARREAHPPPLPPVEFPGRSSQAGGCGSARTA